MVCTLFAYAHQTGDFSTPSPTVCAWLADLQSASIALGAAPLHALQVPESTYSWGNERPCVDHRVFPMFSPLGEGVDPVDFDEHGDYARLDAWLSRVECWSLKIFWRARFRDLIRAMAL